MAEFMRRYIAKNDEKVVKCAHGANPVSEHPCLGTGSEPERFDRGIEAPGHQFRNEF
jgi:hypothetical protein